MRIVSSQNKDDAGEGYALASLIASWPTLPADADTLPGMAPDVLREIGVGAALVWCPVRRGFVGVEPFTRPAGEREEMGVRVTVGDDRGPRR